MFGMYDGDKIGIRVECGWEDRDHKSIMLGRGNVAL